MIVLAAVPAVSVAVLLFAGAGVVSFLVAFVEIYALEFYFKPMRQAEKERGEGVQP